MGLLHDDAAIILDGWIRRGHCQNIMNPNYTFVGNGFAYVPNSTYGYYYTQDFASPLAGSGMTFAPDAPTINGSTPVTARWHWR